MFAPQGFIFEAAGGSLVASFLAVETAMAASCRLSIICSKAACILCVSTAVLVGFALVEEVAGGAAEVEVLALECDSTR